MRKIFWILVGRTYVLVRRNARLITPLLLIFLVVMQFGFLIYLSVKIVRVEKAVKEEREASLQVLNRVYSQVWLLNNRVNSVLEKNNK